MNERILQLALALLSLAGTGLVALATVDPTQRFMPLTLWSSIVALAAGIGLVSWTLVTSMTGLLERRQRIRTDISLNGIWGSVYAYPRTEERPVGVAEVNYYVAFRQQGSRVFGRSRPTTSASVIELDLALHGNNTLTGVWREQMPPGDSLEGRVYFGAVQLVIDPTQRHMHGKWVGFSRRLGIKSGSWRFDRMSLDLRRQTKKAFDFRV